MGVRGLCMYGSKILRDDGIAVLYYEIGTAADIDPINVSNKIWIENEAGKVVGEVDFIQRDDGNYDIVHTFVDDSLRGQGAAGKLVKAAADEIRKRNKKTATSCTYAQAWFKRHTEEQDLLG